MRTNIFSGGVYVNNGTPNMPSLSFINDPQSGFCKISRDLCIISNGTIAAKIDNKTTEILNDLKISKNAKEGRLLTSDNQGVASWRDNPTKSGSFSWSSIYMSLNDSVNSITIPHAPANVVYSLETPEPIADTIFNLKKSENGFTIYSNLDVIKEISQVNASYITACRLINDNIGICYYDVNTDRILYKHSLDKLGKEWSNEIIISEELGTGSLDIAIIDECPAIVYIYDGDDSDEWHYIRASDENGAEWNNPHVVIDTSTENIGFSNSSIFLRTIENIPTIFYNKDNEIRISQNNSGIWASQSITDLYDSELLDVQIINNEMILFYKTANEAFFTKADNEAKCREKIKLCKTGTNSSINASDRNCGLYLLKNKLCIIATDETTNKLYLNIASDNLGTSWGGFNEIAEANTNIPRPQMFLNNENCYVIYNTSTSSSSKKSLIKLGADWSAHNINLDMLPSFSYSIEHIPLKNINDDNTTIILTHNNKISLLRFYDEDFKINWISF